MSDKVVTPFKPRDEIVDELDGFRVGGCVRLASGGPKLTIRTFTLKSRSAVCEWFNGDEMYESVEFLIVQLRHAPEDAATVKGEA